MAELAVVPITDLTLGVALPVPIYDANQTNLLLLNQGIKITTGFIDRLKARGITHIAIDASKVSSLGGASGPSPSEATRTKIRREPLTPEQKRNIPVIDRLKRVDSAAYTKEAVHEIKQMTARHCQILSQVYVSAQTNDSIAEHPVRTITEESIDRILADIDVFVRMAIDTVQSEETFAHCMRVSHLAMSVATLMGLKEDDIVNLGIGCLLSRVRLSDDTHMMVHQDEALTNGALLEFKRNLRDNMYYLAPQKSLNIVSRQVATQVFERWDGSGFPHGKTGIQISNLARIAMVVDCYITLNSPRTLAQTEMTPYQTVERILNLTREGRFDPQTIPALLNTICLYPLGSLVELSNGVYGQVVRTTQGNYDRPIVKAICRLDGSHAIDPVHNLANQSHIKVVRALKNDETANVQATHADIMSLLGDDQSEDATPVD